ncbi:MAG: SurA N-terminal domain-containing protein [Bacteroidia bacterium]
MTILARIRSRVGLLVGIIFLALLAFVLTDLFNSQRGLFGGNANNIGEINGNAISYAEFRNKMDEYAQGRQMNETEQNQLSEGVWQEYVEKYVFEPQYSSLGILVSDDELADQMMGNQPSPYMNQFFQNPQTGEVNPQFAGPDGKLSGKAIREFVKKMTAEQETQWAQIEQSMRKTLVKEKYNTLIRKGFYVTKAQAKREYTDENTKYNFKFIVKKYADLADSLVKVTDEELQEYYKSHQYKFKQRDAVRNMEYVAFNIFPSADDIAQQRKDMEKIAEDFRTKKTAKDDSLYVAAMSDNGTYAKQFMRAGQFPVGTDSSFLKAQAGEVLGPFNMGENTIVYKVYGQKLSSDSAKVRHILVTYKGAGNAGPEITRTKEQAKLRADSIMKVVKSGRTKMEDLVEKLTDDPGSKQGNKGDYGWFTPESGFVQPFKDAGFNNPKGATVVVETDFGYHVIQVLDKTAETKKVEVATIEKKTEASETTIRNIFNQASEFAGLNNTAEKFDAAAQKNGLTKAVASDITENARMISGLENGREIIRWMYNEETEVGTISQPFQSGERYVVCKLTRIVEKGFKPLEDVKDICKLEVVKAKKAQMFTDEMNKKRGTTLDQWASNMQTTVMPAANITFASPYIQGAGYEGEVVGTLANLAPNKLSAPIKGTMGVYVVVLETVAKPEPLTDIAAQQQKVMTGYASRTDAAVNDILREEANITDNRGKHF